MTNWRISECETDFGRGFHVPGEEFVDVDIVVVVPMYNESVHIAGVIQDLPAYIRRIIIVDDASTDNSVEVVEQIAFEDERVMLVRHAENLGVGGAMVTGFRKALQCGAEFVVKIDADGQMSAEYLPALLRPLIRGQSDFTKGNRFRDFGALRRMPTLRRSGNVVLSFLMKAAIGYWNCFDPCNGFIAIHSRVLAQLPLEKLGKSYFFEMSLLSQLYLIDATVKDVPMPAIYGNEVSHLSLRRVLIEFPPRLIYCLVRRIFLKKYLYDFAVDSLYLLAGLVALLTGSIYGSLNWIAYAIRGLGAPTGTVVLSAMLIIVGMQLLLAAIAEDIRSTPVTPIVSDIHALSKDVRK